jgi:uncharacterized membrane protein YqaE (UPF0057 family)
VIELAKNRKCNRNQTEKRKKYDIFIFNFCIVYYNIFTKIKTPHSMSIAVIILSVFLPPAAVAMEHGVGKALLINILLTLLGGLPGIVHALWVNAK